MQRDFILRTIEEFGRFARALREMILGGEDGSEEVGTRLRSLAGQAGLDLDLARAATLETLLLFAAPSGELDPCRCWMYAETLYLDGLEASLTGDQPRAECSLNKARRLFELVAPQGAFLVGFPEAGKRIEEIETELRSLKGDRGGDSTRTRRLRREMRRSTLSTRGGR